MSSNTAKFKINSTKDIIAMLVAAGFMFFFRFIPAPEPITPYGMAILGIFIGVVIGWCASGDQTMWATFLGLFALSITLPAGSYVAAMNFLSGYVFMFQDTESVHNLIQSLNKHFLVILNAAMKSIIFPFY